MHNALPRRKTTRSFQEEKKPMTSDGDEAWTTRAAPPLDDLPAVLNASQQRPFLVCVRTALDCSYYRYTFAVRAETEPRSPSLRVTIERLSAPRKRVQCDYALVRVGDNKYVIAAHGVASDVQVKVVYRARRRTWTAEGRYADMCKIFTLNSVVDGMGPLSDLFASRMTVEFRPSDHTMHMTCVSGVGGLVCNRGTPADPEDLERSASTRPEEDAEDEGGPDVENHGVEYLPNARNTRGVVATTQ
jgi:hypothetical protein